LFITLKFEHAELPLVFSKFFKDLKPLEVSPKDTTNLYSRVRRLLDSKEPKLRVVLVIVSRPGKLIEGAKRDDQKINICPVMKIWIIFEREIF